LITRIINFFGRVEKPDENAVLDVADVSQFDGWVWTGVGFP
jgi:hypothetical protein